MSSDKSALRTRLTRAAAAIVSVGLLSPLALINSASADTSTPSDLVTTATVLDATDSAVAGQTNVGIGANGPLTGLVNGSKVRVTMSRPAGQFFGADARLCRSGANISSSANFAPTQFGNCIAAPFNAQSDDFVSASAAPLNQTVTFDFRVGTGSQTVTYFGGATRVITCDATNPCELWFKQSMDTAIQPDPPQGQAYIHYNLTYAGTPDAPTAVGAAAGNTQATVNWTAPANTGNAALLEYEVVVAGGPGAGTFTVPAAQTSTTITGLSNFAAYTVTVAARNRAADGVTTFTSAPSAPATSVTPAPGGPTNVSGVPGNGRVDLTWTAPAGPAPDSYEISANPGAIVQNGTAATSHSFTGLANGTVYTFTVRARYGASFGASSAPSAGITPNSRLVTQTITVRRPQGALVLTQVCGARGAVNTGTAPTLTPGSGLPDDLFPQYPYPVDVNGDSVANYPTNCGIELGNATLLTSGATAGQYFRATGFINQVTVVDTRDSDDGWEASGQMADFVSGPDSFSGSQLGWDPIMTDDSDSFVSPSGPYDQLATEGASVAPSTVGGLGISKRLAIAAPGAGLGIARLDADLDLYIPVFANAGTYTGILTITAV